MSKLTLDPKVIAAFAKHNIVLEHIPADGDCDRDFWVFDGGHGGPVVELWVGINGHGHEGVFGTYSASDYTEYSLACRMSDWVENYAQYIPYMVKGENFDW